MQESFRLIEESFAKRDIKKAEVLIAKLLRSSPTKQERVQALILRARARLMSARPDDALDDIKTVQSIDPSALKNPALLELFGDSHFARFELASVGFADRSDTVTALQTYEHILRDYPDYENLGWIDYQMGRALLTDNHVEAANECFHKGLLAPSHYAALTAYCYERLAFIAFYEARDYKQALTLINKAVDTYPPGEDRRWLVQVHVLRCRILREMHRFDQALWAAEMALSVASSSGESKAGLAEALLAAGELLALMDGHEREVIAQLQQFMQISKKPLGVDVTWSRVQEMLGDAYLKTGQYLLAAGAYEATLQFNPYHPWELSLYFRIARAFYQAGDYERAIQSIYRMLAAAHAEGQSVSDYRVYDVLGNALYALRRYDDALDAYRQALQMAPPNADNLDKIRTYHDFALELRRPV
jgi:tetratricopeptide (TPR) repeat protein